MADGPLGGWGWVANMAIDFGAPVLGAALGVPMLAPEAAKLLKRVLGLAPNASEATVQATVAASDPETLRAAFQTAEGEAAARWQALAEMARVRGEVDKTNITEINTTIREELAQGVSWYHWRHLIGYVVVYMLAVAAASFTSSVFAGRPTAADLVLILGAMLPIIGVGAALNGYVAADTTNLKQTAITGERGSSVLSTVKAAIAPAKR